MQDTGIQFLGWEDPLEKKMATQSCILAWEIPWTELLVDYGPWSRKSWTKQQWTTTKANINPGLGTFISHKGQQAAAWGPESTNCLFCKRLHWDPAMPTVTVWSLAAFTRQWQSWRVEPIPCGWQSWKYLPSGPWQKEVCWTPWISMFSGCRSTEVYSLMILESGRPRSMCQQDWFLLKPLSLACRWSSPSWIFRWHLPCACRTLFPFMSPTFLFL